MNTEHLKKKDELCQECGYASSVKDDLNKHILSMHTEKTKFPCDHVSETNSVTSLQSATQDKSIISFDTFLDKNNILLPQTNSTSKHVTVNVDLYVI